MKAPQAYNDIDRRLEPGERILGVASGGAYWDAVEYYATDKKIVKYESPGNWLFFLRIFGMFKKKHFAGAIEYSKISGTEFFAHVPFIQMLTGIILGVIVIGAGVVVALLYWGDSFSYVGWAIAIIGLAVVLLLSLLKQTFCQLKIINLPPKGLEKWRIYISRSKASYEKTYLFANIINDKLGSAGALPGQADRVGVKAPVKIVTAKKIEAPAITTTQPTTVIMSSLNVRIVLPDNSEIPVTDKVRTLGRDDFTNHIPQELLRFISRRHLSIGLENSKLVAADTNSSNGSKLNREPMRANEKYELKDGDILTLGEVLTLVFRISDTPSAAPVPAASGSITFLRQEKKGQSQYYIYRGPDRNAATEFLNSLKPITEFHIYYIVETPEGNLGCDKDGIYQERI